MRIDLIELACLPSSCHHNSSSFQPLFKQRFERGDIYRHDKCRVDTAAPSHMLKCGIITPFIKDRDPCISHWLSRSEHRFKVAQAIAKIRLKVEVGHNNIGPEAAHQRYRLACIPSGRDLIAKRSIQLRQLAVVEADN